MGAEEKKPGFFGSIWMTVILVAVLIILGVLFIWVLKTGWFYKLGKKKQEKPVLKPQGVGMIQQLHNPVLELADNGFVIIAESELS